MKIKVSEAEREVLDWMVSMIVENSRKFPIWLDGKPSSYAAYSTDWAQGGPIIEREEINLLKRDDNPWHGYAYRFGRHKKMRGKRNCTIFSEHGPTPLIAAMRCYVASKLGDEIDVPEELTK